MKAKSHIDHIDRTLAHFFYVSHIIITSPSLQTDIYVDEIIEIFLQLSMQTVQVHLIIWNRLNLLK